MHYYKRNLGDYAKKAGRLSMLQHGSYTLLIDACYDREAFPTLEQAIEWTWASTTEEIEAVTFVLRKFFTLENGVYVQKRIEEEIAEYHGKAETNRRIAIERETRRKELSTNRARTVNEAPPNQEPLTKNQEPVLKPSNTNVLLVAGGDVPKCPHQEIIALYRQILPQCHGVRDWTAAREKALATRWKEKKEHQSLAYWESLFKYIASCPFLVGKAGNKPFLVSLDWICKAENFAKIREGRYEAAA